MKRVVFLVLVLGLVLGIAAAEEEVKTYTSGDYEYTILEDGTACIYLYTGEDETLKIPDKLDGRIVTCIENNTFLLRNSMTSVTIPDSVTNIDANPFRWCGKLRSIKVSVDHPALATIDGVLFRKADKRLVCYPRAT